MIAVPKHPKTQLHSRSAPAWMCWRLACRLARPGCLWAALGLLANFSVGPRHAQAAVVEAWVQRYNPVVSNSYDEAVKVVRDAAGDIIVTGVTADGIHGGGMLTIKYSGADGSLLWQA